MTMFHIINKTSAEINTLLDKVTKRETFFADLAAFNTYGGAATYGEGPVWIGGSEYWSNGSTITPSSISSNTTKNKIAILGNSIVCLGAGIAQGSNTFWAAGTAKVLTNTIIPNIVDLSTGYWANIKLTCTQAGTTGTTEPIWSETVGAVITDGTVQWTVSLATDQPSWSTGWWHLAQQKSGQRLDELFICGMSGQLSTTILQYYDRMMSTNPDIVYFANMFENDCGNSPTLLSIQATWDLYESKVRDAISKGKKVIIQTCLGNASIDSTSAFTGYSSGIETKCYNWINSKIRWLARDAGCILFDIAMLYPDPNPVTTSTNAPVWPENATTYLSETGTGQQLKKTDGVHPNIAAAWIISEGLSKIIIANFVAVERFSGSNSRYQLTLNPSNFGTAGTNGSGTITGNKPNLMAVSASGTGGAATVTAISRTDMASENNFLQCVYTATTASACSLHSSGSGQSVSANPDFAPGAVVQGFFEIKVLANPTLLTSIVGQLFFLNGTPFTIALTTNLTGTAAQDVGQFITSDVLLIIKTPPIKVPAGTTAIDLYSQLKARGACNVTGQFGRQVLNLISVPSIS